MSWLVTPQVAAVALVGATVWFAQPAAAADVLVNGGFDSGFLSPWTTSGGAVGQVIGSGVAGSPVAILAFNTTFNEASGALSQSFTTSAAGQFDYAFDIGRAESFGPFNDVGLTFAFSLDGQVLSNVLPDFDPNGGGAAVATRPLNHYAGSVALDAGAHELSFGVSRVFTLFGRNPFFVIDSVEGRFTPAAAPPDGGTVVPEPATWALMILGFGAAGTMLRRRRLALA